MTNTEQGYNAWASQYDTNHNKTRDLEGEALRQVLANIPVGRCLEVGCGTGKNTVWLVERAVQVTAIDLSEEMMARARNKVTTDNIAFYKADITGPWTFVTGEYDLVTFSLILEHIDNLDHVFYEAAAALKPGGYLYLGELHPFKQYTGTKARFDTPEGRQVLPCFNNHITDFTNTARHHGLYIRDIGEFFDSDSRDVPRILTLLFQKA